MTTLLRLLRYIPAPREMKEEWQRKLIHDSFAKDISAARAARDYEKVKSLEADRRHAIQLDLEESDLALTRFLISQARRLHVPVPQRVNDDGWDSDFWYEGQLTHDALLTTEGVVRLRDEIRREKKARHEAKAVWIPWLSAVTGVIGAATGLVALLIKSGPL